MHAKSRESPKRSSSGRCLRRLHLSSSIASKRRSLAWKGIGHPIGQAALRSGSRRYWVEERDTLLRQVRESGFTPLELGGCSGSPRTGWDLRRATQLTTLKTFIHEARVKNKSPSRSGGRRRLVTSLKSLSRERDARCRGGSHEALWPEEEANKLGNRLSVALTTLRAVLDPKRRFELEHFVTGGKATVGLQLENLRSTSSTFSMKRRWPSICVRRLQESPDKKPFLPALM